MRTNTLVVLIAIATLSMSSAAMARGSGGGGGGKGWSGGGHFGHSHFVRNRFDHRFLRNRAFLNGWGWDWGWAPYDNSGYGSGNTTVVAFPLATPQVANGSVAATPCHWNAETFTVPSSTGGTGPVQVVSCR
jgi:hypothetical protein